MRLAIRPTKSTVDFGRKLEFYPANYRQWFIRRCFEALNESNPNDDQGEVDLASVQEINSRGQHRNVGLVVETRPDLITTENLIELRKQGVTKIQLGVQSMDDRVLELNKRGHSAEEAEEAIRLVRAAGFKVVAHWMPNLLGATPDSDREDYGRLWREGGINPDELKIYPCQLLRNAELFEYWQRGEYKAYTTEQLIDLLADIKPTTPRFCRINRVIRDIPSNHVVEGAEPPVCVRMSRLRWKNEGRNVAAFAVVKSEKVSLMTLD